MRSLHFLLSWTLGSIGLGGAAGCHLLAGSGDFVDQDGDGEGAGGRGGGAGAGGGDQCAESCDDSNPCTADSCASGTCVQTNVDGTCPGGVCDGGQCTTLAENCTNGVDDNGDGKVDCSDPICTGVGFSCVESAPTGWQGPVATIGGGVGCLGSYTTSVASAHAGLMWQPAQCGSCSAETSGTCAATVRVFRGANACDPGDCSELKPVPPLACGSIVPTACGSGANYSVGLTTAAFQGSCTLSCAGEMPPPAYTWSDDVQVCSAGELGICDTGGGVCAPPPNAELRGFCIWTQADAPCPQGSSYSSRQILYGDATDSRTCTSGTSAPPSCVGAMTFYDGSSSPCGSSLGNKGIPSTSCASLGAADGTLTADWAMTDPGAPCTVYQPAPSGDVVGTDPVTVCCTP